MDVNRCTICHLAQDEHYRVKHPFYHPKQPCKSCGIPRQSHGVVNHIFVEPWAEPDVRYNKWGEKYIVHK